MTTASDTIIVRGARCNNLRNIDLDIPKNRLVVVTGVSGCGKSSLVFDTLYTEGQRRYLESFSAYARRFTPQIEAPEADLIDGLPPAVAIEQTILGANPRSTVGTLSEILNYLRILFVHLGTVHCDSCDKLVRAYTIREMVEQTLQWPPGTRLIIVAPLDPVKPSRLGALLRSLRRDGFARARVNDTFYELDPLPRIPRRARYQVDVVVDRLVLKEGLERRLAEGLELAVKLGHGCAKVVTVDGREKSFFNRLVCPSCQRSFPEPSIELFSFWHPLGACPACKGMGRVPGSRGSKRAAAGEADASKAPPCPQCDGSRFAPAARSVRLNGLGIHEICRLPLSELPQWLAGLPRDPYAKSVSRRPRKEIEERIRVIDELGLSYLCPERSICSLSSGETQRLRLARQFSQALSGILYALDEPSSGLHARDQESLLAILLRLRDQGNSVLVVEHDLNFLRYAQHVIDLGPGAGVRGGQVLFSGPPEHLQDARDSLTARYYSGRERLQRPGPGHSPFANGTLAVAGARGHNLRNITVRFPLQCITCVTGVSGSGKSSLVIDTLYRALRRLLYRSKDQPLPFDQLSGTERIDHVYAIDRSPIGRTPRSTPATYTGLFQLIRNLFASLPEAKARGYGADRFSYNVKGGRCETCSGDGVQRIEMTYLPDVFITCPECDGRRYHPATLEIRFKGASIADVLDLNVSEARALFENLPAIRHKLQVLEEVGLGYLKLGQPATTLSGGEAQRIKLARELGRKSRGRSLYIMDEPTTGLHLDDVQKLLDLLERLVGQEHTVIMIEHHLELIRLADYVIDLGPGGGPQGGAVVAEGSPELVAREGSSATGQVLRKLI